MTRRHSRRCEIAGITCERDGACFSIPLNWLQAYRITCSTSRMGLGGLIIALTTGLGTRCRSPRRISAEKSSD